MALRKKQGIWETTRVVYLPVGEIKPNPGQPRKKFSNQGIEELAGSILEHGILQPLTVRKTQEGIELISGERRLRAAKLAGLSEVPCLVAGVDEEESSLLALVENLQRRDLSFMEEAQAIARLIQLYGLSQEQAAQKIGKSQSAVANKLRLLRLCPKVLQLLQEQQLTERHARALLRVEDEKEQLRVLEYVIGNVLNVAQTEAYIDSVLSPPSPEDVDAPGKREQGETEKAQAVKPCPEGKRKRSTYVIKDVRLFLNSITRGLRIMKTAGVEADYGQTETDEDIVLTIRIPKQNMQSMRQ